MQLFIILILTKNKNDWIELNENYLVVVAVHMSTPYSSHRLEDAPTKLHVVDRVKSLVELLELEDKQIGIQPFPFRSSIFCHIRSR